MGKIDAQTIHQAYDAAKRVYAGQIAEAEAIAELVHSHAMNRASATIYVKSLKSLLEGETLKRTMSASSFAIYLDRIADDYGKVIATRAIAAVRTHVTYYNSLKRGKLNQVGIVCDSVEARLA